MSAAIASTAHPKGTGAPGAADGSDIEDSFFPALIEVSQQVGCNPVDLLAVMKAESNVCPGAVNPHGGATGLIQFMPETLKKLGWSEPMQVFAELSATDQLPWVQQFLKAGKGQFTSPGRIYQFIFLPATMGTATQPGDAVATKDSPNAAIAAAYASNEALDINKDGKITIQELTTRMQGQEAGARWTALVTRLKAAQAGSAQTPPAAGSGAQAPTPTKPAPSTSSGSAQPPADGGAAGSTPGASGAGKPDGTSQSSDPSGASEADPSASDPSSGTSDPSSGTSDPSSSASDPSGGTSEADAGASDPSSGTSDPSSGTSEADAGASDSSESSEPDSTSEQSSSSDPSDSSGSSEAPAESASEG